MNVVIGLIPAVAWGLVPIVVCKLEGKISNQILGCTLGTFLFGIIEYIIISPELIIKVFIISFISGVSWAFGQIFLLVAYTKIGVSKAMPITTAMQLIGNCILGVVVFGEWPGIKTKLIGFAAIVVIMAGANLSVYSEKKALISEGENNKNNMKVGIFILLISVLGYVGYSGFSRASDADGWTIFFPQK